MCNVSLPRLLLGVLGALDRIILRDTPDTCVSLLGGFLMECEQQSPLHSSTLFFVNGKMGISPDLRNNQRLLLFGGRSSKGSTSDRHPR